MINQTKKIILSGGGTGGSVTPLLAVVRALMKQASTPSKFTYQFIFVGTKLGPEKKLVAEAGLEFKTIVSGKWRRYWSLKNLVDLFKIKIGFWQSLFFLLRVKPDLVMSAGGFVSVPLVWASGCLRIPVVIHQQDIRPGLANKLMAKVARVVTVTFAPSLADYGAKAVWIGNPSMELTAGELLSAQARVETEFNLNLAAPIIFIFGGGTGAVAINDLVKQDLVKLTKLGQVVHLTGRGKEIRVSDIEINNSYKTRDYLDHQMTLALISLATVVVARAGLGTLTELASQAKPSIIIPMPHSHQEDNANILSAQNAAIVLEQNKLVGGDLEAAVANIINDSKLRENLCLNIKQVIKAGANQALVDIVNKILAE